MLRWSLLAGCLYFLGVAVVHMIGLRVPGLYVYFDVPSHAFQDRIISVLAFGWSLFLFTAFTNPVRNRDLVSAILAAGAVAVLGLGVVNLTTHFGSLSPTSRVWVFWLETLALGLYVSWLVLCYFRARADLEA
ncbi:hypothetical protein ACFLT5_04290 [Chloroflexota bacterium]